MGRQNLMGNFFAHKQRDLPFLWQYHATYFVLVFTIVDPQGTAIGFLPTFIEVQHQTDNPRCPALEAVHMAAIKVTVVIGGVMSFKSFQAQE